MRRWLGILLMVFLLSSGIGKTSHFLEDETFEASGISPGSSLTSRSKALNKALRAAIEQVLRTMIDPETMEQNSQLLDDEVYSNVERYFKGYKIIDDNEGEGEVYRIKVSGKVIQDKLKEDLEGLGLIKIEEARPHIMVVFLELIDGLEQPGQVAQIEVEKAFLKGNFPLVEQIGRELIRAQDITLSYEDPLKAAALGRRYGAQIIIVGQATSDLVQTSKLYDVSIFCYKARISARAVRVDSASIIASGRIESLQRGPSRISTAKRALQDAGANLAYLLMEQIMR